MESNRLREVDIKNRTSYCFDAQLKSKILILITSYQNIWLYYISYKTLFDLKPMRVKFNEEEVFIRIYDGIR